MDEPLRITCEVLIIGSGPGGASTAALLAEAGRDVVLIEEGGNYSIDSAPNYTLAGNYVLAPPVHPPFNSSTPNTVSHADPTTTASALATYLNSYAPHGNASGYGRDG